MVLLYVMGLHACVCMLDHRTLLLQEMYFRLLNAMSMLQVCCYSKFVSGQIKLNLANCEL